MKRFPLWLLSILPFFILAVIFTALMVIEPQIVHSLLRSWFFWFFFILNYGFPIANLKFHWSDKSSTWLFLSTIGLGWLIITRINRKKIDSYSSQHIKELQPARHYSEDEIQQILDQMSDEDYKKRIAAAEALGDIPDARAKQALINAIQNPQWFRYKEFVEGNYDPYDSDRNTDGYWLEGEYLTIHAALESIGKQRAYEAVPALVNLARTRLGHGYFDHIIDILIKVGGKEEAIKMLSELYFKSQGGKQKVDLAKKLNQLGWHPSDTDIGEAVKFYILTDNVKAVEKFGKDAIEPLIQFESECPTKTGLWNIAEFLANAGDLRAIDLILKIATIRSSTSFLLEKEFDRMNYAEEMLKAGALLRKLKYERAFEYYNQALKSIPNFCCYKALEAATRTDDPHVVADLFACAERCNAWPSLSTLLRGSQNNEFITEVVNQRSFSNLKPEDRILIQAKLK